MTTRGMPKVRSSDLADPGPAGFAWAIPGVLGGVPRPGLGQDIAMDIAALRRLGVSVLISLQEEWSPPAALLARMGIDSVHFPIADMGVPAVEAVLALVDRIEARIAMGGTAVYHCHGGRGRTGTLVACHFVRRGMGSAKAIRTARARNAHWIETGAQLAFVEQFSEWVSS